MSKTKMISFFGPPGSGKGTIAQRCVKELGWVMLSTGDLCRQHIQDQTELGKQFQACVQAGHLIPDQLITTMVVEWLKGFLGKGKTIILDGYPRTKEQGNLFVQILKNDKDFSAVDFSIIDFHLDAEEIVRRISNRIVCSNKKCQAVYSAVAKKPKVDGVCDACGTQLIRRPDDAEAVVRERLTVFARYKDDLLNFYKEAGEKVIYFSIPAGSPDVVFEAFKKII